MVSTSKATTPLSRYLGFLGLTQDALAKRLGIAPARVSKLVRRVPRPKDAARILDEIDPERKYLTELYLLYPERYPDWEVPVPAFGYDSPSPAVDAIARAAGAP